MKKNFLLFVVFAAILLGASTFLLLSDDASNDEQQEPASSQQANDSNQRQDTKEVTQSDIERGIAAKQQLFEDADPEYPDAEKIIYERFEDSFEPDLHPADQELWDIVEAFAPTKGSLASVGEFIVYYDTEDTTLASVASIDDNNNIWSFEINYISVEDFSELAPTLAHEFAHIVSLEDSQTTTVYEESNIEDACPTLVLSEGCLNDTSYLAQFYDRFWKNTPSYIGEQDRTEQQALEFFDQNPDLFVSDYATTNVVEDFAESLRVYVLEDKKSGDSFKEQKVRFFDEFDVFVDYRNIVRSTIASWTTKTDIKR